MERDGEEFPDEEEVEELLLDFGVHEYFIGHAGSEGQQVDPLAEPLLTHHPVDLCQRHHILPFEALPSPHALLVVPLQSPLAQVLDYGDEDILGVVFLKSKVRVGVMRDVRRVGAADQFRMTALLDYLIFLLYLFRSKIHAAPRIKIKIA